MTALTLATILHVSLMATSADTYAEARRKMTETGKPMVVMVGTDWCMPCQRMKNTVLPEVRKDGVLSEVSFAMVNRDRDGKLARQLTGGGPVPQLVMYRKTAHGWKRRKLVGGQSVIAVERFIKEGLALDKETGKETGKETEKEAEKR